MNRPRIYVATTHKEVEKPQGGGGKGQEMLYAITVCIDGEKTLYLTRNSFTKPGQMARFAEAMQEISAPDLGSTVPPKKKK